MQDRPVPLSIGDFSRMTYLSIKALRHYHDIGLLAPAGVDPSSGYRRYHADQVPTAQVIRRLRDLGMPLDEVKAVLRAPDLAGRNAAIAAHLDRMQRQLERTRDTVDALRALLDPADRPIAVQYRTVPRLRVLGIRARLSMDSVDGWWAEAFGVLHDVLTTEQRRRTGPDGALYSGEFFEADAGEVIAFVPVGVGPVSHGRVEALDLPAVELAITVHRGRFDQLDQTYGALGTYVAEREIGVLGPIREHYLDVSDENAQRIEVCWPVFRTDRSRNARQSRSAPRSER